MQVQNQRNITVQKWVVAISIVLFALKILAYYLTNSVAVLTDALESTVNVVTGLTGLYALRVAIRPRDEDHPYGHGKAELLSASLEGVLIIVAGLIIIYESLINLQHQHIVQRLDAGMIIIASTAIINFGLGAWCIRVGKKEQSIGLMASGKHLQSDTWTTVGIIFGLILLQITKISWIDSAVAMISSIWIIVEGSKILRNTISGIMDEADQSVIEQVIDTLNQERPDNWIDIHNLRTIKFGNTLHVDCHLTVPWYFQVLQGHDEAAKLHDVIGQAFDHHVEMFVHLDACLPPQSCTICGILTCTERKHPYNGRLEWTLENVTKNARHGLSVGVDQA
jgi:cation diffusion facilitator family transporter